MDEITKKTFIPKELAEMISEEAWAWWKKGMEMEMAVGTGTLIAVNKWRIEHADKSGS